jgi:ubiquinone biosynthesis protein COQ4
MVEVSKADYEYFNGAIQKHTTESSVLISSSSYLNNAPLRALIAQEMLRRNGPDLPNTAFIPEVAQILHDLEDMPTIIRLFEEEKARLPEFKAWLDRRMLSDFKIEDVKHCKPGTLGHVIHDFLANSGYNIDYFFQGMKVDSDYTYYLKERTFTHDIEHMVTGFETNHAGEVALLNANMYGYYNYFRPELAAFFNRVSAYLKAKTIMKSSLHYPEGFKIELEAEYIGATQGRNWKMPLMMIPWRDQIDRPLDEIRAEYGITDVLPPGCWSWTTALVDEGVEPAAEAQEPKLAAAE